VYLGEKRITEALQVKHENLEDIFASQVKIGPMGSKIMDAVAIKKTWSPKTVIGYEIKTSRQDFLNDQKYPVYMDNCNIFYFVTPKNIIKKGELPIGAGHMIYNPDTKSRLRTVIKAPYRKIAVNPDVLLHIMFWKMNKYFGYRTRAEILEDYKAKKEFKILGDEVAKKIINLEIKLKDLDGYYYKEKYDELHKKWRERFGSYYIDFDEIPNNGLNQYDIKYLENVIKNISKMVEKLKE